MVLRFGPLVFPLRSGADGPTLVASACGSWEAAARLANAILHQSDLQSSLARGDRISMEGVSGYVPDRAIFANQARVGNVLADDAYAVDVTFLAQPFVYPRSVLVALVDALLRYRAAPPSPDISDDPLAPLEAIAREVCVNPRAAARVRPTLLAGLKASGVLDPHDLSLLIEELDRRDLPTLGTYVRSVVALQEYGRSVERAAHLPSTSSDWLKIGVSLDWFRLGTLTPPGYLPYHWLAFCERALVDVSELPPTQEGEVYTGGPDGIVVVLWRRDDGIRPVVIAARLATISR